MRLLRREHWDRGTIACPNWTAHATEHQHGCKSSWERRLYCTTCICSFLLAHASGVSYPLLFYTAGNAEVQEGAAQCSCDWCPVGTASSIGMLSPHQRHCHTIYQSLRWALCYLPRPFHHVQSYYISSPSPVFTRSYFQKHFYLELETLWERPVSMLFFLTGGKEKVAFRQFIKFCLDQGTILWYCAKPQCQLSVRCQKIIYT